VNTPRTRPIRVLQVIDTLGMGGAEAWLMALLRFWSKTGEVEMDFLMTSGNPGIFDDEARRLGAKLHYVRYDRLHLPQFAKRFRGILRHGSYLAIHDHQDYVSGWHFLFAGSTIPPVRVTHVHKPFYQIRENYGVTPLRRFTAEIGKRLVARHATHIAATSRQSISEHGFDTPRFARIPTGAIYCGFDVSRFAGDPVSAKASLCSELDWPESVKIVLVAGRIDRSPTSDSSQLHKNSAFGLSVGIECARRDSRLRMLFAGELSPAVAHLEAQIAAADMKDRIRFLGVRNDIERLMLASDVLLFPSRGEGLGMVAVEAQAAGLPVMASSAVPRECAVVPGLVRFQKLEAGVAQWATDALELAMHTRNTPSANHQVAASAFAIENSARALVKIYGEGTRA
jgi:glycosyltransferase involved in cell wall biosynthesis